VVDATSTGPSSETTAVVDDGKLANPSLNMMLPRIGVAEAECTPTAAAAATTTAHRLKVVYAITWLVNDDDGIQAFAMPRILSVVGQ
jgi:hypothetical protein